jgi:hypothetical protein
MVQLRISLDKLGGSGGTAGVQASERAGSVDIIPMIS